jgi:tetratricopeptide (TPR) repeat protein
MNRVGLAWFVFFLFLGSAGLSAAQDLSMRYYQAGNTLYLQKNYDRAILYYNAALQTNPNLWQAYQGLGNCSYAQGDKVKALSDYQKCLSLHPDNPSLSSFTQSLGTELEKDQASLSKRYWVSGRTDEHFEISPSLGIAIQQGYEGGDGFWHRRRLFLHA